MCLRNVDLFPQARLVDHRNRFYMSHRGSARGTQNSLLGITSTGTEKMLNKTLLNEGVNEQMACIFRNILWINPLNVRKGFTWRKSYLSAIIWNPWRAGSGSDSRGSFQEVLKEPQMAWNSRRGPKLEAPWVAFCAFCVKTYLWWLVQWA